MKYANASPFIGMKTYQLVDLKNSTEERLSFLISFGDKKQLPAVPKLADTSYEELTQTVHKALNRKKSKKENFWYLLDACQHNYELIFKSVRETKILEVTNSPNILLLKTFKVNWKNVDFNNIQMFTNCNSLSKIMARMDSAVNALNQDLWFLKTLKFTN